MKFGLTQYTLDHFFAKVLEKYGSNPSVALVGEKPISYIELGQRVDALKTTLRGLGVKKGDKIIIIGSSSPNWATTFMAVMTMGAVAVPVLEGFPENDVDHIIKHSEAKGMFISESLDSSLNLSANDNLDFVIKLDDFSLLRGDQKSKNILEKILGFPEKVIKSLDKSDTVEEKIDEEDLAEILYTSGTTGHSKGVMITHKNLVSNLFEGPDLIGVINEKASILSILPMAHGFGSTSAFLSIIYCGASIHYLNKPPTPKILMDAMQQVKPTILGAVPLVFEKIYYKRVIPAIAGSGLLRMLSKTTATKKLLYKMVGKKIYKLLGGRLDCVIIGGAHLSPEVETFLKQGGIPYCLGYGLTECSPLVSFGSMETQKMGSPGYAITDVELKILDPNPETGIGEILVKGPNVMKGYYKNEKETAKAFTKEGWFITGDKGYIDEDGFLFLTGRSKNVIIGPSGENIYPEVIEAKLSESIFVEEALVYMLDKQLVARIYPNYTYIENLQKEKEEEKLATDITQILEDVRKEINTKLPAFSKINKVIEQSAPFVTTPTNKIKRAEYVPGYLEGM